MTKKELSEWTVLAIEDSGLWITNGTQKCWRIASDDHCQVRDDDLAQSYRNAFE